MKGSKQICVYTRVSLSKYTAICRTDWSNKKNFPHFSRDLYMSLYVYVTLLSFFILYIIQKISFTLNPTHDKVVRGNLVLRHSVPYFPPSSGGIVCWVAELNAALYHSIRNINVNKYFISTTCLTIIQKTTIKRKYYYIIQINNLLIRFFFYSSGILLVQEEHLEGLLVAKEKWSEWPVNMEHIQTGRHKKDSLYIPVITFHTCKTQYTLSYKL